MNRTGKTDEWRDVTRPMIAGMVHWPGDPEFAVDLISDINRGDTCNVSRLTLCAHTGTHMDAPFHFLADGVGIEAAPLNSLMGSARVIAVDDPVSVRRAHLEQYEIMPGERIFIKTANCSIPWDGEFCMDYVYIAADAAQYLAEKGIALLGVDYMSVGGFYQDMVETHKALLGADVWIVENLDLREIEPGNWEIICLPLKIVGGDGAPARVLMRPV